MTRSAGGGCWAMWMPMRPRISAWWAGTGVRRAGSESTTWTWQPRLARWRAPTRPPPIGGIPLPMDMDGLGIGIELDISGIGDLAWPAAADVFPDEPQAAAASAT